MTTQINSTLTPRTLEIDKWDGETVFVRTHSDSVGKIAVNVPTADLLDAIRTELNVIIIDKTDLPDVVQEGVGQAFATIPPSQADDFFSPVRSSGPNCPNGRSSWHRNRAAAHLALAEYLDANPPVDEAQVEALASVIREANTEGLVGPNTVARRLVERGVRVEVAS